METPDLSPLRQALQDYFTAVDAQGSANPPDLLPVFEKLDAEEARVASQVDPQLRHYLKQKSYRKAWLFIEGREGENQRGNCGR